MRPNAQIRQGLRAAFGSPRVRILLALTSTLIWSAPSPTRAGASC